MPHIALVLAFESRHSGDTVTQTCSRIARVEQVLEQTAWVDLPVVWNAPSLVLAGVSGETAHIREWIQQRSLHRFVPMGLSGVHAAFVTTREWESDLEWAISNIWGSGTDDMGFDTPPFLLVSRHTGPPLPDYTGPVPVVFHARTAESKVVAARDGGEMHALRCFDASGVEEGSLRAVSRQISRSLRRHTTETTDPIVIVLAADQMGDQHLTTVLNALPAAAADLVPAELPPIPDWPVVPSVAPLNAPPPPIAAAQEQAADARRRRMSRADRRSVLERTVWPGFRARSSDKPATNRDFVASMMGSVTLAGPVFDVLFESGRPTGLRSAAGTVMFEPVETSVRGVPGELGDFTTAGCFSFESESVRGVRVVERVEDQRHAAECVTDYSFVGEIPVLVCNTACVLTTREALDDLVLQRTVAMTEPLPALTESLHLEGVPASGPIVHRLRFETAVGALEMGWYSVRAKPIVGKVSFTPEIAGAQLAFTAMVRGSGRYEVQYVTAISLGKDPSLDAYLGVRPKPAMLRELGNGPHCEDINPSPAAPQE